MAAKNAKAASGKLAIDGGTRAIPEGLPMGGFGNDLIGKEEEKNVLKVLRDKALCRLNHRVEESAVYKFEQALRKHLDTPFLITVNSAANGLYLSLLALGVGPGDEVLVTGMGWVCCPAAVIYAGAIPVPVEMDDTLTMDTEDLEKKITPRTKAIMVVHNIGLPANMEKILKVARKHNLKIVEDVAQSFGTQYRGQTVGTIGDAGVYSFNAHKILSTGEGGAIVVKDPEVYMRVVQIAGMYAFHHWAYDDGKPVKSMLPTLPLLNFRMPELGGAVGLAQLKKVPKMIAKLRARNREVVNGIKDLPGVRFAKLHDAEGVQGDTLPLVFDTAEQAAYFQKAMFAEGCTNVSGLGWCFGGSEHRGTGVLCEAEGMDPFEQFSLVFADGWKCMNDWIGPNEKFNPWKMAGTKEPLQKFGGDCLPKTRQALARMVAFKFHVHMEASHTKKMIKAAKKVLKAMQANGVAKKAKAA